MELVFEWDERKARDNLRKHRISFEQAKTVFNDPLLITFIDVTHSDSEERYLSIGLSVESRILLVVHTEREQEDQGIVIRIISCRRATPSERRAYSEGAI